MCDKKTIWELREESELKKLWHKTNETVEEVKKKPHSTGTEFQEDYLR